MQTTDLHLTREELYAGLAIIRQAPVDRGVLKMIVRRPAVDAREVLPQGELTLDEGLVGDTWKDRVSRHMDGKAPNPAAQITLMNSRAVDLMAGSEARWPLAGDQLYVDLDLSEANLPPGSRLAIGSAVVEISAVPHTGCAKFSARFGVEAHRFVNSQEGRPLRLRGVNARVVQPGVIRVGDAVRKLPTE